MPVKQISIGELMKMSDCEGIIFQGCGGNLQEWMDGINNILTEEGILLNGSCFREVFVFEHKGLTNLLFKISNDLKLDIGKLSIWRLRTHDNFNGTWLSDYLLNRFGIDTTQDSHRHERVELICPILVKFPPFRFDSLMPIVEQTKPDCPIIGADGNIYNILGIVKNTLDKYGRSEEFDQLYERVKCGDYYDALAVIMEYVNPISVEEQHTMGEQT